MLLLVCLWPLVNFANENREQLLGEGYILLATVFVVACVVTLAIFFLLRKLFPAHTAGAALAAAALCILFFTYPIVHSLADRALAAIGFGWGANYVYLAVFLVVPAVLLLVRNRAAVDVLLAMALVAVSLPVFGLATFLLTKRPVDSHAARVSTAKPLVNKPNVYYIVSDGYARSDQLRRVLGFDNTQIEKALAARGFFVAAEAYSNYPATFMSLTSPLLMDYIVTEKAERFQDRSAFYRAIQGDNPVVAWFRGHGYKYAHAGAIEWSGSACGGREDACLGRNREARNALLQLTPVWWFANKREINTIEDVRRQLDGLRGLSPLFLYAHTIPPHPPQNFNPDCTRNERYVAGWHEKNRASYVGDIRCVNAQMLELIDTLDKTDPDAIILWHSDHGSAFAVDRSLSIRNWPRSAFDERFGILMAIKLPATCRNMPYPSLSPVNTFRLIMACLEGRRPEFLPDLSYVSAYEKHDEFGAVHLYPK